MNRPTLEEDHGADLPLPEVLPEVDDLLALADLESE